MARKGVRITVDRGNVGSSVFEFRNVCTRGILDVCKMAGHTCVSAIVRGYIQEDQAFPVMETVRSV